MSNLIPFQFENHKIRVVVVGGCPMFSARDVALALGYSNPSEAYQEHCKHLKKLSYSESLELNWANPNRQGEYVMPEGDVYRLVAKSKLESAQRFESWVYDEVIPSVRKTGKYETPKTSRPKSPRLTSVISAHKALAQFSIKVSGVKPGIATAVALLRIEEDTGINTEAYRKVLPGTTETVESLNATNLGKLIGKSAREINRLLADMGMQQKNERGEWELTEKGKVHGAAYPFAKNGHASYQILWKPQAQALLA